ncbi:MAG TPA: hypothetical protein VJM08_01320, partial [Anaerolineales bacterium]|nr:hypothetical protein [Anaerolineales bacterium]
MPSVSSTPGFLRDLFTPLPENQTSPEKDPLDHAADYADTSAGAWDVFRCVDHALSWLKMLPSLPDRHFEGIQKVKDVASAAGMGLSVPKMIADFNTFRRGLCSLFATQDLPYSDPLRTRKIAQAAKKSFIDAADLTNTVTQAALFADNAKLVLFEAGQLNAIDGVNNLTSVISDGSELITECVNLQNYHSAESQPRNQAEAAKLAE